MKVIFDHCVPNPFRKAFSSHEVRTTAQMGWENLQNGLLLNESAAKFDVLLTVDKNIKFQQNLNALPIAVIVPGRPR